MKTVGRIIEASVRVFNRTGISQASLRSIAEEVGISHGNLAYHFANKAKILEEIYSRMEAEMDDAVLPEGEPTLRHYHSLIQRISAFHDRYRFFYLDLLEIARHYPEVIQRYRRTIALRFEQYDQLMTELINKGLIQPEPEPGLYRSLFHSIWVMSTFWLQHRMVLGEDHPVIDSRSDSAHVWEIMLPHLTAKGLREYHDICGGDARDLGRYCP
jgi:AcrR family transcriptional regulator